MWRNQIISWSLFVLIASNCIITTYAYPQVAANQLASHYRPSNQNSNQFIPSPEYTEEVHNRKFAEKPNALKKVALDDIDDDLQTNQIQDSGFSWTNMIGNLLQMFFAGANNVGPNKSDDLDGTSAIQQSPWTNVIAVGLKFITTLLGGGQPADGIDKVDNAAAASPMQSIIAAVLSGVLGARDPEQVNIMAKQAGEFINIVVTLMDALKTSFSHRSMAARSIGKKDSVSDAAVAGIAMIKSYVKTYKNDDEKCMQKYLCEANLECNSEIGGSSIFCQLGTYATSFVLERTTGSRFEGLYEAGRKGRSGENCRQIYLECNEV